MIDSPERGKVGSTNRFHSLRRAGKGCVLEAATAGAHPTQGPGHGPVGSVASDPETTARFLREDARVEHADVI
jgi:hypothetical protein